MKINRVIQTLTLSEFLYTAGFGFFAPVFAIFATQQIDGGSIEAVGFAAAIGQLTKSVLQIPIARYLDRNHGEYDDFISLVLGQFLMSLVPFLYLFSTTVSQLYFIAMLLGVGLALAVPPWHAIFTRHIDSLQENIEWSFVSVSVGVASASAAALGGMLAARYGFELVFFIGGICAVVSAFVQLKIFGSLKRKVSRGVVKPIPTSR